LKGRASAGHLAKNSAGFINMSYIQETPTIKYYLAGPMTGYPEFNIPAFRAAKLNLEAQGFEIELPYDIDNTAENWTWGQYLAEDIKLICDQCQGIILLPEWERSRGAKLEIACGLMQSLKFPNFEFRFYSNGKASDPVHRDRIAIAWYWNWETYSKEVQAA